MKTIIIITTLSIILVNPLVSNGQWEIMNEGFDYDYSNWLAVDFISKDMGWMASSRVIFITTDGAENWIPVYENEEYEILDIDFYNNSIGWAIADLRVEGGSENPILLKTPDGGKNWTKQDYPANGFPESLTVLSESNVIVTNYASSSILSTSDGGASWKNISPSASREIDRYNVCFYNKDTGVVVSEHHDNNTKETFYRTYNGGRNWHTINTLFTRIYSLNFQNDSMVLFMAERDSSRLLYKSIDVINSWSVIDSTIEDITSFHCYSPDTIVAFTRENNNDWSSTRFLIIKSTDGGASWSQTDHLPLESGGWGFPAWMHFVENTAYLISSNFILKSTDQGNHWNCINFSLPLNDIHFINREQGFIVGYFHTFHANTGFLLKTFDGGRSWNYIRNSSSPYQNIHFFNDSTGGIFGWGNYEYTNNGGESWTRDTNLNVDFQDFYSLNDSVGWMLGKDTETHDTLLILKTMDGALSWDKIYTISRYYADSLDFTFRYNALYFLDENKGYVVGDEGCIIKFSEPGQMERIESGTTLPLNKILFFNEHDGLITGGYVNQWDDERYGLLLKTEDGGENWSKDPEFTEIIHDLQFQDTLHGFAVGEDSVGLGIILETFDKGNTWEEVISAEDSLAVLRALHFKEGVWWAVGDNSLILKLDTNPVPEIKDTASRFMVVADLHHYSPLSDFTQSMLYEFAMAAIEEEVDFIFVPGDLIVRRSTDPTSRDSINKDWLWMLDTLQHHNIRFFACRGNNDAGSGSTWDDLFSGKYQFPQNGPEGEKNRTYALEYDNLLFIALDEYTNSHKINQVWLDSLLSNISRVHIFAAGHEPAFKIYKSDCLVTYPEDRNLFWESLTDAGAHAYFSGHAHFYDHTLIDDGDGDLSNDVHQVIVGTGGGYTHPDAEYNGDSGRWIPQRLFHDEPYGYVLVELDSTEATMIWKRRTEPGVFEFGGDSCTFPYEETVINKVEPKRSFGDSGFQLYCYPNPFHYSTTISYYISAFTPRSSYGAKGILSYQPTAVSHQPATNSHVELSVYDMIGRKITTLVNEYQIPGVHEINWHAEGMEPGIYFCVLTTGQNRHFMKMVLSEGY